MSRPLHFVCISKRSNLFRRLPPELFTVELNRLRASGEDVVHHVEHTHTELLRHRCEPRRSPQSDEHVGKPLPPSSRHCRAAELEGAINRADRRSAYPTYFNIRLVDRLEDAGLISPQCATAL